MKKILISVITVLIMVCALFVLTGCENKKDENKSNGIVGTWEYKGSISAIYTFNDDGTGIYDFSGQKMEFTYKTDKDKISITYKGNTAPFDTVYEIKDNELNIKDSFGKDTIYKRK